jgi:hypothetical protein
MPWPKWCTVVLLAGSFALLGWMAAANLFLRGVVAPPDLLVYCCGGVGILLGLQQYRRLEYWARHLDLLPPWCRLTQAAVAMSGHRHAGDGTCYTLTFGLVRGRVWYVVRVVPGVYNRYPAGRRVAAARGVVHAYLFRAGDYTITHHHVPYTIWPDSGTLWPSGTLRHLVRYRRDGVELTGPEMDELTTAIGDAKPRP